MVGVCFALGDDGGDVIEDDLGRVLTVEIWRAPSACIEGLTCHLVRTGVAGVGNALVVICVKADACAGTRA